MKKRLRKKWSYLLCANMNSCGLFFSCMTKCKKFTASNRDMRYFNKAHKKKNKLKKFMKEIAHFLTQNQLNS